MAGRSDDDGGTVVLAQRRGRPRLGLLTVGLMMTAGAVAWTLGVTYPTGLGTMLGLVLAYALAAYYLVAGIARARHREDLSEPYAPALAADPGWIVRTPKPSWRCSLLGHRERFIPRTQEQPPLWECRRCGAQSRTHLRTGQAWLCEIPLVDHRYDYVGRNDEHPEFWRCRRCGKRRFTMPRSAGETLEAVGVDKLWVRKGHE